MMIRCERATEEDDHAIGHLCAKCAQLDLIDKLVGWAGGPDTVVDKQSLFAKLVVLTANLDTAEWPDGLL